MSHYATLRVSVVIAAYNAEATIRGAIDSCLRQTLLPYEIIVADDASTDGTAALLEAEFPGKLRLLRFPVNQGPSAARNAGMAQVSGDYIALLDADDSWHPRKLELCMDVLSNTGAGAVYHDFVAGEFPKLPQPLPEAARLSRLRLLAGNPIATPCIAFKKQPGLLFDPVMRHMEDYDFFLRLAEETEIRHLPVVLTRLGRPVLSAGGLSAARWKMRRGELKAYRKFAARKPLRLMLLPLLYGWSMMKHLRGYFRNAEKA